MNYAEQERYFARSRMWGVAVIAALLAAAGWLWSYWEPETTATTIAFALIVLAICISVYYGPDYLHLTVNSEKRARWAFKIRWRTAAVVFILGSAFKASAFGVVLFVAIAAAIVLVTIGARHFVPKRLFALYFWISDLLLIFCACYCVIHWRDSLGPFETAIVYAFVSASAQFSLLISGDENAAASRAVWIFVFLAAASVMSLNRWTDTGLRFWEEVDVALLFVVSIGTALLVRRASKHQARLAAFSLDELKDFSGHTPTDIWRFWETADSQLAANWESAGVAQGTPEEIAEWYRQNSELYMFAISAYNLEYKRIKSNLRMLGYASGACLDYGAGNGELILECARRGHRAAYYDVDGVSKRFAQFRAAKYGLQVEFTSTKAELRRIAEAAPFDTIFSFDVLEHIPDLAGELDFLISLLGPNGLLIFDVPAGATVSHPMHLNHTLNVKEHLIAQGLKEVRMRSWRIGKQEKYAFRKAVTVAEQASVKAVQ